MNAYQLLTDAINRDNEYAWQTYNRFADAYYKIEPKCRPLFSVWFDICWNNENERSKTLCQQ